MFWDLKYFHLRLKAALIRGLACVNMHNNEQGINIVWLSTSWGPNLHFEGPEFWYGHFPTRRCGRVELNPSDTRLSCGLLELTKNQNIPLTIPESLIDLGLNHEVENEKYF